MIKACLFAAVLAFASIAAVSSASARWQCNAKGLISGSYDGGSSAYIHLAGFPSGGTYAVSKKGNSASGSTKNGTRFTCKKVG